MIMFSNGTLMGLLVTEDDIWHNICEFQIPL